MSDVSGHEPAVRLPTDRSIRKNEALHELAWRDLLDLVPGALATLLSRAPLPAHVDARTLATGTQVRFVGGCGSDLFVTCATCRCDRAVVEIKGPTASMNVGDEGWQTDVYRDKYLSGRSGTCQCVIARPTPLLFLLDARNRDHQTIEEVEGRRYPLDLSEWIVLPYKIILQLQPFAGHPLALWLEGR